MAEGTGFRRNALIGRFSFKSHCRGKRERRGLGEGVLILVETMVGFLLLDLRMSWERYMT